MDKWTGIALSVSAVMFGVIISVAVYSINFSKVEQTKVVLQSNVDLEQCVVGKNVIWVRNCPKENFK